MKMKPLTFGFCKKLDDHYSKPLAQHLLGVFIYAYKLIKAFCLHLEKEETQKPYLIICVHFIPFLAHILRKNKRRKQFQSHCMTSYNDFVPVLEKALIATSKKAHLRSCSTVLYRSQNTQ